jgi:hypothetical protein
LAAGFGAVGVADHLLDAHWRRIGKYWRRRAPPEARAASIVLTFCQGVVLVQDQLDRDHPRIYDLLSILL